MLSEYLGSITYNLKNWLISRGYLYFEGYNPVYRS